MQVNRYARREEVESGRAHLDAVVVRVDHEIVEQVEHGGVVAGRVSVADLVGLDVREWSDLRPLEHITIGLTENGSVSKKSPDLLVA